MQKTLVELNDAQVFSKLDLKQGFSQCELDPSSIRILRPLLTNHAGLFQMKRLGMEVELFPRSLSTQFKIEWPYGVLSMADDILVFEKYLEEHKEHLLNVMTCFSECDVTLA